ncbi:MAG: ParB/RepB/Spo0J family partition protein [Bacilli bacterium]
MNLENEVLQINLDDIIPNRFQPRIAFDETGLKELADSIKEHGIIQPLVLRKLGNKYEIIAGERRYKAATLAGLVTVPAIISNIDDNKSAEVALVENIQRRDLTPIEEAKSYKSLLDKGYLTQEQLAKRMGISQSAVANKLRLLNLDDEVQQALLSEKISERHARALLQITDKMKQREWLNRVINERLTVRQLDQEIKKTLEDNGSDGDIPLVSLTPTIEDIKNTAQDIQPIKPTFDFMNSSPSKETELLKEESIVSIPPSTEGKFFNFSNVEPLMESKEESKNIFNPNKDIEVIDMPQLNNNLEEEIKLPEIKEETLNDTISSDINLSSNNKFFTPFMDETSKMSEILTPKEEIIIDPMDSVQFLDSFVEEQPEKIKVEEQNIEESNSNVTIAISETRELVEKLKNKGFKVNLDEIDLTNQYKITITIDK